MKIAIVTGATGFIGSNICRRLLNDGWNVNIITRKHSNFKNVNDIVENLNIYEHEDNLTDMIQWFKKVNAHVVFHLASYVVNDHSINDVTQIVDSNIKFGLEILESMRLSNTKLLINTGTYWQHFNNERFNPVNLYASTKEAFMCLTKYYIEAEDIRVLTLDLFDTYGVNDTRLKLINLLNQFASEKKVLEMSLGEQSINLVYIDDVVSAYLRAYDYMQENLEIKEIEFGVGSLTTISLRNLVEKFMEQTGKVIQINWGGRNYRNREVMIPWNCFTILPGWECKVTLEEGLKKFRNESID